MASGVVIFRDGILLSDEEAREASPPAPLNVTSTRPRPAARALA